MNQAAKRKDATREESIRVLGRGLRAQRGVHLTLRALREAVGKTQLEVTELSAMDQGDISRLEARENFEDCQVSTLQRYLSALGGQLELVAAFGDKRIIVSGVQAASAGGTSANKPLQRSYVVQEKRAGTDRDRPGTRDPVRGRGGVHGETGSNVRERAGKKSGGNRPG